MNDTRKKTSRFTLELQLQTDIPQWSLANEKAIYYLSIGEKPIWGPKSRKIAKLMAIFYFLRAADILIFGLGLYRAGIIWLRVKKNRFLSFKFSRYKRVFVGFGASSEEHLYARYINQSQKPLLRINSGTHADVHQLVCPSLLYIIFILVKNSFGYSRKIKTAGNNISNHNVAFLTICALNIGIYSFYRSYWHKAKLNGIEEVIFLAADIISFSCVDEKIQTIFHQHGLIGLSILFPKFDKIYIMTSDEERYLKKLLDKYKVDIYKLSSEIKFPNHRKNNNIIILSPNVLIHERLIAMKSFIEWIQQNGWNVIMRPTPRVTNNETNILHANFPSAIFDDLRVSFDDSIDKWQPKAIVSWLSTGLATALDYKTLPISLCEQNINDVWWNMIYPLRKKVLFWHRDRAIIESALQSDEIYASQLDYLKNYNDDLIY